MKSFATIAVFLTLALSAVAQLEVREPKTFITDKCGSDDDCTSGCCSFKRGQCVGPVVAQERAEDGGCGFGNPAPNRKAADAFFAGQGVQAAQTAKGNTLTPVATPAAGAAAGAAAGTSTLQQQGQQFITGPCNNDNECARKCCNFKTGLCAAPIVAKEAGAGCGRGSGAPIFKSS